MKNVTISLIAGARPNFMKIAPLIPAFNEIGLQPRLIHTGQHYDRQMSETFFEELCIPPPDINLGVGSGTHVWQISEVMRLLEREFCATSPAAVVVVGDVNSTLAAAITANKLGIPVAHVEAGLRSFDRGMPEEVNRVMTDAIADWLFTSESQADDNLLREGVDPARIYMVGNVMIDTLFAHLNQARQVRAYEQQGLKHQEYALLTLHRPSNVDDRNRLAEILAAIQQISAAVPVVFPVHPRTRTRLDEFGFSGALTGIRQIEPQGYHSMVSLMEGARFVMTDSGGIQEETTALGIPCVTLRENTERPVTIVSGSNRLAGCSKDRIIAAVAELRNDRSPHPVAPKNWDGNTSLRIADVLRKCL